MWHEKAPAAAAERSRARWVSGCLPAPAHPPALGLFFPGLFTGFWRFSPGAAVRQRTDSVPAPRCQLASQRLAPLGPCRAGVHLCCLSVVCGFGFLGSAISDSALWVSASGSLCCSVLLLSLVLFLLCFYIY